MINRNGTPSNYRGYNLSLLFSGLYSASMSEILGFLSSGTMYTYMGFNTKVQDKRSR